VAWVGFRLRGIRDGPVYNEGDSRNRMGAFSGNLRTDIFDEMVARLPKAGLSARMRVVKISPLEGC